MEIEHRPAAETLRAHRWRRLRGWPLRLLGLAVLAVIVYVPISLYLEARSLFTKAQPVLQQIQDHLDDTSKPPSPEQIAQWAGNRGVVFASNTLSTDAEGNYFLQLNLAFAVRIGKDRMHSMEFHW